MQSKSKLYMSARGYDSWPDVQAHMHLLCLALAKIILSGEIYQNREFDPTAESASVVLVAAANDAPLRHLGADLARAFIATKPLPCFNETQMPYPVFLLNLPCGLLLNDTGASVNTVVVASYDYWRTKCQEKGIKITGDNKHMQNGGLQVVGLANDGTQLIRTVCWDNAHLSGDPEEVFCSGYDSACIANAIDRMMRIVLNSMSAMTWRKDLLETEKVTAGIGFNISANPTTQRPIYWIGKNYIRKQSTTFVSPLIHGTKSPHWRSGHWHTVKYGQQRQKAKLLWFEPIYVNASVKP
jgi:hypothetical protein